MSNINKLNEKFLDKLNKIYTKDDLDIIYKWFNCKKRKTAFRVNTIKSSNEEVIDKLLQNNLEVKKIEAFSNTFILLNWDESDLWKLDLFKNWFIYLQSISSQIPVEILDIKDWAKILDLTAAPWWKTSQAAAKLNNTGEIIANDNNSIRIDKLKFTLNRQWVKNAKIIKNDARNIINNNPVYIEYFDYIIADLPCSAEWKFNTNIEKSFAYWSGEVVKKNYKLQKQIIKNSIDLLKKWWELVYSTCTISPEENEDICHMILCNYPYMELVDIELNYKYKRNWLTKFENKFFKKELNKSVRILPSEESEWFFIAKFKKKID